MRHPQVIPNARQPIFRLQPPVPEVLVARWFVADIADDETLEAPSCQFGLQYLRRHAPPLPGHEGPGAEPLERREMLRGTALGARPVRDWQHARNKKHPHPSKVL